MKFFGLILISVPSLKQILSGLLADQILRSGLGSGYLVSLQQMVSLGQILGVDAIDETMETEGRNKRFERMAR